MPSSSRSLTRRTRLRAAAAVVAAGALALAVAPGATADRDRDDSGKSSSLSRSERAAAVSTLQRAESLLDGSSNEDPRSATLALRDVRMLLDTLPPDLAARAQEALQRPADEGGTWVTDCDTAPDVCVHHLAGADVGGGEYTVEDVAHTVQDIHDAYVDAGYREPLPDGGFGGTDQIDVYLEDLGDDGLYGYCTSDDPKDPQTEGYDLWAYCAFDDDFSSQQFPTNTPLENMQVTAAHEYFHATQYAYDAYEDGWILEATATWAEDELYDDVDDNHNYFGHSPIAVPEVPLDYYHCPAFLDGSCSGPALRQYGTWVFFRHLTESHPQATGGMPNLVRQMWERLDGSVGGPDSFSLQGLDEVLAQRGTNLATAFARFAVANRAPAKHYEEGRAYPTAPAKAVTVTPKKKNPKKITRTLDHLTSSTVRFRPSNLGAAGWKLGLKLDLAPRAKGSAAVVTVVKKSGARSSKIVKLDAKGDAGVAVGFSSKKVAAVEVTLLNVSARLDCWRAATPYSCYGGVPQDENLKQSVDAIARRR